MDPFRRNQSLSSQAKSNGSEHQRRKDPGKKVAETDENEFPSLHNGAPAESRDLKAELKKNALFSKTSSLKKKVLAERNEELLPDSSRSSHLKVTPQSEGMPRANPSGASYHNSPPISLRSYDPITNYTSPRPKFLRYNPNQRRELLKRLEGEKMENEEVQSESSLSTPHSSSRRGNDSDYEEEEEFEEKPSSSFVVWSVFLLFGVSMLISYCMGASSFERYESYADNIQKVQDKASRRLVGKSLFSESFLGSLMSSSQMCLIVRESLCNPEENLFVSLETGRTVGREHLREGETLIPGIRSELSDKTEVLVAEIHDPLLKNGVMVDDYVAEEKMEHVDQNKGDFGPSAEGNANKSITSAEILKKSNITSSSVDSLLVSVVQDVSDSMSKVREDKFHNESLESIELSSISQARVHESTPPEDDQGVEDFNFSSASETELESDYSSSIISQGVLRTFSIFLGSLIVVIGLLSSFHKYFRRMKVNSLHVVPSPPSSEFCRKTETGEEIVTDVSMKEENLDKALDMSVESKSSRLNSVSSTTDYMNDELIKVSGFEPPRVELLGEFSLMDARVTNNGFGSNLTKMEYPNSQFSYYQNGKARKMLSPLPDMLDSSPEKSTSSRFSSKVLADIGEISDTSTTSSLRRSSRLRNRNRVI